MPTPRSGNVERPRLPKGAITIQPPPDVVEGAGPGNILAMIVPMFGSMGIMVFMAFSANANPRMLIMGGVMVVLMIAMVAFTVWRQISQHQAKVTNQRREYLAYLSELRADVRRGAADQRSYATWNLPNPAALPMIVQQRERVWERASADADTFTARIGTSTQRLVLDLNEPELSPLSTADPVCLSAATRFVSTFEHVEDLPVGLSLAHFGRIELAGNVAHSRDLLRSMVSSLVTLVGPDMLKVALVADAEGLEEWDWLKWLPHVRSEHTDALGGMRMMGGSLAEVLDLVPEDVRERARLVPGTATGGVVPQLLVIADGVQLSHHDHDRLLRHGICLVELLTEWDKLEDYTTLRLIITPRSDGTRELTVATLADGASTLTADIMSRSLALTVARRLARYGGDGAEELGESAAPRGTSDPTRQADLLDLLRLGDIRDFDPNIDIVLRQGRDRLNVPFAVTPEGVPVKLDIKENAQQGMGPHGLLIGATGSGKSEVLRTIVLAMALTHSPEQLNFVLVDFKGGATFAGMSDLPHVSATITNLESELSLVDRMEEALHGEMVRRQEVLRAAGNYANVSDYERDRRDGRHSFPPMPALFIILDEFSELLTAKPAFIDTFVAIGRLGRSLEIHLLLSTQRLEESKLRGLESHLSYRVGLRTFSAQDSRAVLGTPDAYELPAVPGVGFLKTAGEGMSQFRASYIAAKPKPRKATASKVAPTRSSAARILPFTAAPVLSREPEQREPDPADLAPVVKDGDEKWEGKSIADIAIEKLLPMLPQAHQVWLPPLDVPDTLDQLFSDLVISREYGLHSPSWRAKGRLIVPIGIKDVPREQRREHMVLDLTGGAGNFAVYGAAQTGKSTVLRTLILALSLVNTPREVSFYILDFGGGTFTPFRNGAHVAGVATRDRPDVVHRIIAEVTAIMADREAYFREHGIDSIATYRRGRDQGRYDDGYGDVFLVVDGWNNMKADFMDLDRTIQDLAGRGLALGVHLVVATARLADMRQALQGAFGSVFELRLGEPRESTINTKRAALVPEGVPGRGLSPSEHHVLAGLPRIDSDSDVETLADGVTHAWEAIANAWQGQPGPKLRMLPEMLPLDQVRAQAPEAMRSAHVMLGIDEARLEPIGFDPKQTLHMFVFGDGQKGKTMVLRTIAYEIMRLNRPPQAQFFLVDFRRTLLQEIPDVYLAGYYTNHEVTTAAMREIAGLLRQRLPGKDITPQQLRDRSWWQGPEFYIMVDDLDLVNTSQGNPLVPIVELLPQARDIGLHLFIARRSGGASRALFDPSLRSLIDLGAPALLLPGDPEEGPIVNKVRFAAGPAGRAQLVDRRYGRRLIQVAHAEPRLADE